MLVLGGGLLALGFGQRLPPEAAGDVAVASLVRRATLAVGGMLERADGVLRRWPVAGLSLLALVIMFVWSLL